MGENGLVRIEGREKLTEKEIVEKIILSFDEAKNNFKSLKNTEKLFSLEERGKLKLIPKTTEYIRQILDSITNKDGNKEITFESEIGYGLLEIKNIQHLIIGLLNVIRKNSNLDPELKEDYAIREENEVIQEKDKNNSKFAIYGIFRDLIIYKEEQEQESEKLKGEIYDNNFKEFIKRFIVSNREKILNTNFLAICQDESVKNDPELVKIIGDNKLLQFFLLCLIEDYTKSPVLKEVADNPLFQDKIKESKDGVNESVYSILDNLGDNKGIEAKDLFEEIEGNKVKEQNVLNENEQKLLEGFLVLAKNLDINIEDFRNSENPFIEIAGFITNIFQNFDKIIELEETKYRNLELELEEKEEKIKDFEEQIKKAKSKDIGALKAILKELEIDDIEKSNAFTILSRVKNLNSKISKLSKNIGNIESENHNLNINYNEIDNNYKNLIIKYKESNKKEKELNENVKELNKKIKGLILKLDRSNKEKEEYKNKYNELKDEGIDIENLDKIKTLEQKLNNLELKNITTTEQLSSARNIIEIKNNDLKSKEEEINNLHTSLGESTQEMKKLKKQLEEQQKIIEEYQEKERKEKQQNDFKARSVRGTYN